MVNMDVESTLGVSKASFLAEWYNVLPSSDLGYLPIFQSGLAPVVIMQ